MFRFSPMKMVLLVLLVVVNSPSYAVASDAMATEQMAGKLETIMADLSRFGVLGSVIAVDIPGSDAVFVSTGFVDVEKTVAMDAARLFQIGSQTKMFTSAAIQLLARDGKLNLSDKISDYVTGVTGSANVSIQQLLTHSGGIGDSIVLFDPPAIRPDYAVSFEDHLLLGRVAGPKFEAGEGWEYNNLAFVVLGEIVEIVSGEPLNEFVKERLLLPLGMDSTYLGALEGYPEERMARGYFLEENSGALNDTTMPELSWASSAGDMISSATDMLKWSNALLNDDNPTGLTLKDFQRDSVDTGSPGNMKHYALGLMGRDINGTEMWGHGGNIHGYLSLSLVDASTGISVVLMTNLDDFTDDLMVALEGVFSLAFHMSDMIVKNNNR